MSRNERSTKMTLIITKMNYFFRAEVDVRPGDFLRILNDNGSPAKLDWSKTIVIDSTKLIVLNPDTLISGTTVSNAIGCLRRAVLNHRFKVMHKTDVYW